MDEQIPEDFTPEIEKQQLNHLGECFGLLESFYWGNFCGNFSKFRLASNSGFVPLDGRSHSSVSSGKLQGVFRAGYVNFSSFIPRMQDRMEALVRVLEVCTRMWLRVHPDHLHRYVKNFQMPEKFPFNVSI
jgi:hypothetical protein